MNRNQDTPILPHLDDCARTWRVSTDTARRLKEMATELECYDSVLVDMLLQRALSAVAAGQWVITRKPYKFTLHWGEGSAKGVEEGMKRE